MSSNTPPAPIEEALPPESTAAETAVPAAAPAPLDPAAVATLLKTTFPALFSGAPKPIKLHIQADIQARAPGLFSKRALSVFLHRHTGSTSYLMALSRATCRFDLDGQPAGELSAEHRDAATAELARRRELGQQRRAQEAEQSALLDQQRVNRAGLLRDFERTTLTRANFCALKQVAPEELDGLLEMARREREQAPSPAARPPGPRAAERRGERPPGPERARRPRQ